jgi:hypothetical protein
MSGNKTKCLLWQHVVCLKALRALWQDSRLGSPFPEATRHGLCSPQTRGCPLPPAAGPQCGSCAAASVMAGTSAVRQEFADACRCELPVAEARRQCSGLPGRYRETKRRRKQQ